MEYKAHGSNQGKENEHGLWMQRQNSREEGAREKSRREETGREKEIIAACKQNQRPGRNLM